MTDTCVEFGDSTPRRSLCVWAAAIAVGASLLVALEVAASTIVVPGAYEESDALAANGFPFSATPTNPGGFTSQRYQQVYAAGEFVVAAPAILITEIAFRRDLLSGGPVTSITNSSIEILLSTTSATPDQLSLVFDDNVGSDVMTVFSGALTFTGPASPPESGVFDFDFTIALETPFTYTPSVGSLLLEVRNSALATGSITFDAADLDGDSVSRIFTTTGGSVSSSAGLASSHGLVTRFSYLPVPEPGSLAMLTIGLMGLTIAARYRNVSQQTVRRQIFSDRCGLLVGEGAQPVRPLIRRMNDA